MRLGVISDTHGVLRDEVVKNLEGCDYIIHAGDICGEEIFERLNKIARTFVVRGNNDGDTFGRKLPYYKEIEMDETLIYVVHKKEDIPSELKGVKLVIYGHSHKREVKEIDNILYINPGSVGPRRFKLPITMIKLHLFDNNINEENIELIELID